MDIHHSVDVTDACEGYNNILLAKYSVGFTQISIRMGTMTAWMHLKRKGPLTHVLPEPSHNGSSQRPAPDYNMCSVEK